MKHIIISAIIALSAGAAHADPVTVAAPNAGAPAEEVRDYVKRLEAAVKQVCQSAYSPAIGINYFGYLACVKATRTEVKRLEPTGLYARSESAPVQVAAK